MTLIKRGYLEQLLNDALSFALLLVGVPANTNEGRPFIWELLIVAFINNQQLLPSLEIFILLECMCWLPTHYFLKFKELGA